LHREPRTEDLLVGVAVPEVGIVGLIDWVINEISPITDAVQAVA